MARLHVEVKGSGAPVLFLHGLSGSARNWRPQLRALPHGALGIAYDARGHARSEAPNAPEAYRLPAALADAEGVLAEHAGPGRPALWVGLSMGAVVALEAALHHPELVRGLLLASYPGGRDPEAIAAAAIAFAEAIETVGLEAAGARFVWGPGSGLDADAARWVRQGFLEHPPHGIAGTLRGMLAVRRPPEALAPELARLALPVDVVAGERDAPSLPACSALAEAIPGARLHVLPGAGHVVNLSAPRAFAMVFEAAWRRSRPSGPDAVGGARPG